MGVVCPCSQNNFCKIRMIATRSLSPSTYDFSFYVFIDILENVSVLIQLNFNTGQWSQSDYYFSL